MPLCSTPDRDIDVMLRPKEYNNRAPRIYPVTTTLMHRQVRDGARYFLLRDLVCPGMPIDGTVAYSKYAGQNIIAGVARDQHGNAAGSAFDLGNDGGFQGLRIAVLHLYTNGFNFGLPEAALKGKGFEIVRWANEVPDLTEFRDTVADCSQLWIISDARQRMSAAHIAVIKSYFEGGGGVYIWGDNDPFYADANAVSKSLIGVTMSGNLHGNKCVQVQRSPGQPGLIAHEITTGIQQLYEGITIATIQAAAHVHPLVVGSEGNTVTAFYDDNGHRLIIDGGFTRLYCNWDTAGTSRYVVNAAAWLCSFNSDW